MIIGLENRYFCLLFEWPFKTGLLLFIIVMKYSEALIIHRQCKLNNQLHFFISAAHFFYYIFTALSGNHLCIYGTQLWLLKLSAKLALLLITSNKYGVTVNVDLSKNSQPQPFSFSGKKLLEHIGNLSPV